MKNYNIKNYKLLNVVVFFTMIYFFSCSKEPLLTINKPISVKKGATTAVPDSKFEEALRLKDLDGTGPINDGKVLTSKINTVTLLDVSDKEIADFTGIEGFTELVSFNCSNNQMISLDVSQNVELIELKVASNPKLTELNLIKNIELTELIATGNPELTQLDLRNGKNSILDKSKLDFKNNPKLTCIFVDDKAYSDKNWGNLKDSTAEYVSNEKECTNVRPVVNAGADATITLPINTFTVSAATATDSDGSITTTLWEQVSGPNTATITDENTLTPTFSDLVTGDYVFKLTVTDNIGKSASDTFTVTVNPAANVEPVVEAGPDETITLPINTFTVSAASTTDSDGSIATILWTKVSGGTATITGEDTTSPTFSDLEAGSYEFRITATDNAGDSSSDTMTITVNPAENVEPVVEAGPDATLTLPINTFTVSAASATDSDGLIATILWEQVSGGLVAITGGDTTSPTFSDLEAGSYEFRITATDNAGDSSSDTMTITVNPEANTGPPVVNVPPTVNAGIGQTIILPNNTFTVSDVDARDSNGGSIVTILWEKTLGGAATITGGDTLTPTFNDLEEGQYQFTITVTDDGGMEASSILNITVLPTGSQGPRPPSGPPSGPPVVNVPPTVNAGPDATLTLPINTFTVSAASTTDSDGSIATILWEQVSGGLVAIIGGDTTSPTFSDLEAGSYEFRITATDNAGDSSSDTMTITVVEPVTTTAPTTSIPDPKFEEALRALGYDGTGETNDGKVLTSLISPVTSLRVFNKNITDLTGIEAFTSLRLLNCSNNQLTSLDVSKNVALQNLTCTINQLTSLDVSKNVALQNLRCGANQLTSLNVSKNVVLQNLICGANQLTSLDLRNGNNKQFVSFDCKGNLGLSCILVDDKAYSDANWGSFKDETAKYGSNEGECSATPILPILPIPPVNPAPTIPPRVSVEPVQDLTLPTNEVTVTATVTAADSNGSITTIVWAQVSGPNTATITNGDKVNPTFSNLVEGTYTFSVTVTDNNGVKALEKVTINVLPFAPPRVSVEPVQDLTLPTNEVTVTATATAADSNGSITTIVWAQVSGPNTATITNGDKVNPTFSNLVEGTYTFSVTVTDNNGLTVSEKITINVLPTVPLVLNIEPVQDLTLPTNEVTVIATVTVADSNGSIDTIVWTQVSGPNTATITNGDKVNPTFSDLVEGTYTFSVTVTDNNGLTASEKITIKLLPAEPSGPAGPSGPPVVNVSPIINIEPVQDLTLPTNEVTVISTVTVADSNDSIDTIVWTQVSGPNTATITNGDKVNPTFSDLVEGTYTFSVTVTDNNGLTASEKITIKLLPAEPSGPPVVNVSPIINIEPVQDLTLPTNEVTVISTVTVADSNGSIDTIVWTQVSGPNTATITNGDKVNPTFSDLVEGTYTFSVTVTDNNGLTASEKITIKLLPAEPSGLPVEPGPVIVNTLLLPSTVVNVPPTVNAGSDATLTLPINTFTVSAATATDSDGSITTILWEQVSGGLVAITGGDTTSPTFSDLEVGSYEFRITATDNAGDSSSDTMTITVVGPATTDVPDPKFEEALRALGYDRTGDTNDGKVLTSLISPVTFLNVYSKGITNLTGIEAFTSLKHLNCSNNQLTSLDISKNLKLTGLNCENNQLTSLDLSQNLKLIALNYGRNQLTSLDISKNVALKTLYFGNNMLTSIDISKNVALENLDCSYNRLTSLDTSKNLKLTGLNCGGNQLTSLDISKNVELTILYCPSNQLTSLDLRNGNNKQLKLFSYNDNLPLSCILVDDKAYSDANWGNSKDANAKYASNQQECTNAGPPVVNVPPTANVPRTVYIPPTVNAGPDQTVNFVANRVVVAYGKATTNDASGSGSVIASILWEKVSGDKAIISNGSTLEPTFSNLLGGNYVFRITVTDNAGVSTSDTVNIRVVVPDALTTVISDPSFEEALREQGRDGTGSTNDGRVLTSKISRLRSLDVSNKSITNLSGIEAFTSLRALNCNNNQLRSLNVSKNLSLDALSCDNNQLTSLDLSQNVALISLHCNNNQLTSLNVKNGNNSQISSSGGISLINNPSLTCIIVDNKAYSDTNWRSFKDAGAKYEENQADCN